MLYFQLILTLGVVNGIKVLQSSSGDAGADSSAEIMNSDISEFEEFTICFRVISHQFSETMQIIVSFDSMLLQGGPYGIATMPTPDLYSSV